MTLFTNLPTRRFGVEIEFVGVSPDNAAQIISEAGFPCQYEDYNHRTRSNWKIVRDGSIEYHNTDCGELVSPPLSGEAGIEQVRSVLRALVSSGATVNRSCGLHVHVDANDLTVSQICNVMQRYQTWQLEINRFMPVSRRDCHWAKPITNELINAVRRNANTINLRRSAGRFDRYYAVNVAAFSRHGTIEFRQHSASVNNNKVAHWIAFCLGFVAASISNIDSRIAPVSTGRGRRPNYSARRTIVDMMFSVTGATLGQLAAATGYSENTIRTSIMSQLNGFGRVMLYRYNGSYRFFPNDANNAALTAWLGNDIAPAATPAPVAPAVASQPDTLFLGIPAEIVSFYNERAMELSHS